MTAILTPADLIDYAWQSASRDLDHPHACTFGGTFSGGSPAWPVEYGLRCQNIVYPLVSLADTGREVLGPGLHPTQITDLLRFYTQLRAALHRVPHYPNPVLPEDWPRTPTVRFLGRGGPSALAVATTVLGEIEATIARGSGHALRLESADGKPLPADAATSFDSEAYSTWFRRSLNGLRQLVDSVLNSPDALMAEVSTVLAPLEDEHRRWKAQGEEPHPGHVTIQTPKAEILTESVNVQQPDPPHAGNASTKRSRVKREVAEPMITEHLIRRPHDTAQEVVVAVGCAKGLVVESPAWKANQRRLADAKKCGKDPLQLPLLDYVNSAGDKAHAQRRAHREQEEALDEDIDHREEELFRQIDEYQRRYPDATDQEVAREVGCTSGDLERRQAQLDALKRQRFADLHGCGS